MYGSESQDRALRRKKNKTRKGNRSGRDSRLPAERREELERRDSMKAALLSFSFLASVQRSKTKEMIFGDEQHETRWNSCKSRSRIE